MREEVEKYGVSYIASAPEELKVGDMVEIVKNTQSRYEGNVGTITSILDNGLYRVGFGGYSDDYPWQCLRKLPDTISFEDKDNPLEKQVGGNHYKDMAIQPVEFCMKNNLNFCVSSAIKYLCRYKNKNGKQDLEKAKHFIDLLIQLEYPE